MSSACANEGRSEVLGEGHTSRKRRSLSRGRVEDATQSNLLMKAISHTIKIYNLRAQGMGSLVDDTEMKKLHFFQHLIQTSLAHFVEITPCQWVNFDWLESECSWAESYHPLSFRAPRVPLSITILLNADEDRRQNWFDGFMGKLRKCLQRDSHNMTKGSKVSCADLASIEKSQKLYYGCN